MGWSIGYDDNHNRDVGYGVPALCDHPECKAVIDRGISHVCGGEPFGGEDGCGLHFCGDHLSALGQLCEQCRAGSEMFPAKPDHPDWIRWKLQDKSWQGWRYEHAKEVEAMRQSLLRQEPEAPRATPLSTAPATPTIEDTTYGN